MPRYTRKEFYELCRMSEFTNNPRPYLASNIKRKKVILNENGEIDTALPMNQDFLDACIAKAEESKNKPVEAKKKLPKTTPTPKAPVPKAPAVRKVMLSDKDEQIERVAIGKYAIELQKKELELEIKEQEKQLNQIRLDKMNGVVIPTELVTIVFSQHSRSITTAFHQAAENFIVELGSRYEVDKKDIAEMRGVLIDIVNKSVKDSLEDSRSRLDSIIKEYETK